MAVKKQPIAHRRSTATESPSGFQIPEELIKLVRQQRLIPFLGAGVSAGLGLPSWEELLEQLATSLAKTEPPERRLTLKQISELCDHDNLRIAEYLFIKSDNHIGPLRQSISARLQRANVDPTLSTAHVELINLGARYIYTTNYDGLIEDTFDRLGKSAQVVILPRDLAAASSADVQVVKYHGDLQYENTLVLTESSYYSRLEFDSPMDLKFRSDLLGRSVLFVGYSFRDTNIRVIWFKLMQMMRDVPLEQRPRSYIVMTHPNPVLEVLYRAVRLEPIVLDPRQTARTSKERAELLGNFLTELTTRAAPTGQIPGGRKSMVATRGLIEMVRAASDELARERDRQRKIPTRLRAPTRPLLARYESLLEQLGRRMVPASLRGDLGRLLHDLSRRRVSYEVLSLADRFFAQFGADSNVTYCVCRALLAGTSPQTIEVVDLPWSGVWGATLEVIDAAEILREYDHDVVRSEEYYEPAAYGIDIIARIAEGELVDKSATRLRRQAERLLRVVGKRYSSVRGHHPVRGSAPRVKKIVDQMMKF